MEKNKKSNKEYNQEKAINDDDDDHNYKENHSIPRRDRAILF